MIVTLGNATGTNGVGGGVYFRCGDPVNVTGTAGGFAVQAGGANGVSSVTTGGGISLTAGVGQSNPGGVVNITGGLMFSGGTNAGGAVNITGGASNAGPGGAIVIGSGTGSTTAGTITFKIGNTTYMTLGSSGNVTHAAPASGVGMTINGVSGTHSTQIADSATNLFNAGFLEEPINGQTANYTTVLSDSGKTIYYTGSTASQNITIPGNATVAYPTGAIIDIINDSSVSLGIIMASASSDVIAWNNAGTVTTITGGSGTRTLAVGGWVRLKKVTSTRWYIIAMGYQGALT
jgi:hypothetical protein